MRSLTSSTLWRSVPDPAHFAKMEQGSGYDGDEVAARTTVRYIPAGGAEATKPLLDVDPMCVDGGRMARPIPKYKGRKNYSGHDALTTGGRVVEFESRLEHARIMIADFDPTVTAINSQVMELVFRPPNGKPRKHFPDLLLLGADGPTVVDVTSETRLYNPKRVETYTWTGAALRGAGWRYEVWCGADPIVMANLSLLSGYRRESVVDPAIVAAATSHGRSSTMEDLVAHLSADFPSMFVKAAVRHCMWRSIYRFDMSEPLESSTWLTYHKLHDARR
ncbi:hypothetical protein Gbro_4718 [Gordonia bronchialis DSM 43247]|uniref:TnsA endonuclease N-terminal domain-containing protein n=2 Tax=Gordonia bronchialis TaxID=2054 RepID=D0L891_GORB4|nr:TnsA-like heteromeric transposase endonuclease subunit [Gordonia bronchialis]ACY23839.1 hypothetical protein Gbro_4718 [Gordonia bronchialis DSM 43247]QGS22855.1 TnsA-like heteromeric transposase endonuclease subunit [Gordonia bronchialis]STQ66862.1 Uncharacterised protein [Gordonia bronchialis]